MRTLHMSTRAGRRLVSVCSKWIDSVDFCAVNPMGLAPPDQKGGATPDLTDFSLPDQTDIFSTKSKGHSIDGSTRYCSNGSHGQFLPDQIDISLSDPATVISLTDPTDNYLPDQIDILPSDTTTDIHYNDTTDKYLPDSATQFLKLIRRIIILRIKWLFHHQMQYQTFL